MKFSAKRLDEGLLKDLNQSAFTVALADNIDFLQSHAAVYLGSQNHSWHGTSVLIVQSQQTLKSHMVEPLPSVPSAVSMSPDRDACVSLQRMRSSPIDTPNNDTRSPAPKRTRYARTFHEMGLHLLMKKNFYNQV